MKIFRLPILIMIAFAFVLVGCGQKGPLYLQEKQTPPKIEAESSSKKATINSGEILSPTEQAATPNAPNEGNK